MSLVTGGFVFPFHLRACSNAKIALTAIPGNIKDNFTYEIIIGYNADKNTKILLRGTDEQEVANTPFILSCDTFRQFWVSWLSGEIRFGIGELFESEVIKLVPSIKFSVTGISLRTDNKLSGEWIFSKDLGKEYFHEVSIPVNFIIVCMSLTLCVN